MSDESGRADIRINADCNYIAAFLTMACRYRCSYCINRFGSERTGRFKTMTGAEWIAGLSRLVGLGRQDGVVPVTLQGGEPSMHPDFYEIINALGERIRLDVLTNLSFDVEEMIGQVNPDRLRRSSPYASIRVSYHPGQVELDELLAKTRRLLDADFHVGVWAVLHPDQAEHVLEAQRIAADMGIDFRTKEFLGFAGGELHGQYKYPQACELGATKRVLCRTSELLIGSDGRIYRCHHDLYNQNSPTGHIHDGDFSMDDQYRSCDSFGRCSPCDVKIKDNRLQQFGHTSVDIKFPRGVEAADEMLAGSHA